MKDALLATHTHTHTHTHTSSIVLPRGTHTDLLLPYPNSLPQSPAVKALAVFFQLASLCSSVDGGAGLAWRAGRGGAGDKVREGLGGSAQVKVGRGGESKGGGMWG